MKFNIRFLAHGAILAAAYAALTHLQNLSLIKRTHGGASIFNAINQSVPLNSRMTQNIAEKIKRFIDNNYYQQISLNELFEKYGFTVQTGEFGADMKVSLLNDGPVTIILDTDKL